MNLITCFTQLGKYDLHLNHRKCLFLQKRIEFLGHILKLVEMPRPKSKEEMKYFLGLLTFYSRFIPDASTITAPLRHLLKDNVVFKWTPECETALVKLKQEIVSDRVVMPFNPEFQVQLACDASPTGISAVLSYIIDHQERPIAFASSSLTLTLHNLTIVSNICYI